MKLKEKKLLIAIGSLLVFLLWTALLYRVDVQEIGPRGSAVGLATMNGHVHNLFGVHMILYTITDWLGLVPVGFGLGFTMLGLVQWIKRRYILCVDRSILVLGVFYIAVIVVYLFFESITVNYRPVLIAGYLEKSYPSSTTLLTMCVMPTAMIQLNSRIKNKCMHCTIMVLITVFTAFMVIGRLVSGVHWLSDIIGGALLSVGLVMLYQIFSEE